MRLSPCGARQNAEVDVDAGYCDFPAGHCRSASGAFYSIWQIAGRLCFSLSRSSLLVSRGEHDHILIVAVAGLPRH